MAQQVVVSPDFCAPHPITLSIAKKTSFLSDEKYVVNDVNGNVVFKVIQVPFSWHGRRVILDAADRPIVTLASEMLSMHSRWEVFKGESLDLKDLIFSSKTSSMFQSSTKLHVFLANNMSEQVPDYTLKAQGWTESSCVVYAGNSPTIVAQMQKEPRTRIIFVEKRKLMATVHPNVDYAFVVALIVIFEEMKARRRQNSSSSNIN